MSDGMPFRPPWFLRNPHVQTVLGALLGCPRFRQPTRRHLVSVSGGDQLVLHDSTPTGWQPGDPVGILVHGLGGCHDSGYMRRLARLLAREQVRSVRLDLRGAGDSLPLSRLNYHAGLTDDLRAVAEAVHAWTPTSPIWFVGISLGGNTVLKLAGEAGERPVPNLARVAAVGPPIDLRRCIELMSQRHNRFYDRYYTRQLIRQALRRHAHFPDLPRVEFPRQATLRQFDELYTAPRHGFRDADDYYTRASSFPLIPAIRVPTLILTARDDPFVAVEPFEKMSPPQAVRLRIEKHGGHLGFLGDLGGFRWAEQVVIEWLKREA